MTDLAAARDVSSAEDTWQRARLLPTVGIKGQEEQERRATSSLLAVMHAVPEFGHALLRELGAPKSPIVKTFTEVRFKNAAGKSQIPDGAIVCERGKKRWSCLVEVKTGSAALRDEQVASYLDLARDNGFDGVLTISNQITAVSTESPVAVDKRKLRKASLWHFSWWRVLTEAIVQHRYRGISDPDQAWILGELIAYLDHRARAQEASRTWATSGSASARRRMTGRCALAPTPARWRSDGTSSRNSCASASPRTSAGALRHCVLVSRRQGVDWTIS